jgi:glutamate dehydrogenase
MLRLLRQKNAHYSLQKSLNNNSKVISLFSTKVSSNDVDHEQIKKLQTQSMIHEISEMQLNASKEVVPWFLNNMPKAYFRHVPDEARTKHLMAISALKQMGSEEVNLQIESTNDHGRADVTVISKTKSNHQEGLVEQIMTTVGPPNHILSRLGMFNSKDENIHLNIFTYESEEHQQLTATLEDGKVIMSWGDDIIAGKRPQPTVTGGVKKDFFTTDAWKNYFSKCTPAYVTQANPEHFIIQRHLFEQVKGTHSTIIDASDYYGEKLPQERPTPKWLCVASGNIDPESLLKTCTRIINSSGMELFRAHMDTVDGVPPFNTQQDYVTMLRLLVTPKRDGRTFESHPELLVDLISDLKRAKWLDDKVIDLGLVQHPSIGLDRAEVIWALCTMLHGPMVKDRNGTHFASSKSIVDMLSSTGVWIEYAEKIADLFLDKFRPDSPISEAEYNQREADLFASINSLNSTPAKLVLNNMLNAVKSTLRTNFFKDGRYALSLRLDPTIVMTDDEINKENKEIPFGTVFVFGRFFSAFHNRFRDIARGGMRLVTPSSVDQHALESARHFDEVYGLSFAQQLKNKDIPEGGSKAVVLIDSPSVPADQKNL